MKDSNNYMKTNFNNLPDELKRNGLFCLWRYEKVKGRVTKVPYTLRGSKASSTDRNTFCSFGSALKFVDRYSGIGLGIFDGYCAVDIDHCVANGRFSKLAQDVINTINSYTEYSPSGEGVRIIFKADGFKYDKNKFYINNQKIGLEIYVSGSTNKYVTLTGDVIRNVPITERGDKLTDILNKYMQKSVSKQENMPEMCCSVLSDEEVIRKAKSAKNGVKFSKLWSGIVNEKDSEKSHSEADLTLCSMLAFWCGGDSAQIDRLFRRSGLYREKWERKNYREPTIKKAIEGCNGKFYKYNKLPSSVEEKITPTVPDFICFKDKTGKPYVDVPLLAQYVRDHLHYLLVRDNGKQGLLKYVYENGVYKLYADEMFKGCIKKFIEDYDPKLVRFKQVDEVFRHIITDCNYISQDELNAREDIINFRNGLLYVSAEELRLEPHDPQIYSTIQIPSNWTGERSDAPVFADYLKTLTDGDKDTARLLMQFIGVCLSNVKGCRMKKSLFLVGDGDTGKSQLKSLVEKLLGKGNFIGTDLSEIEARFGTGTIYRTRLAGSSDMGFMTIGSLKTFKRLTGGDSVFAEFKGFQGFEFTYSGLLWFCMNRLPKFGGDDGKWVYDRIIVVNCHNVISPERQDKELLDKMYDERQGIIYLAVRALQKVICNGYRFDESESVTRAREKYKSENNTALSFFNECMTKRASGRIHDKISTGKVFDVYREWCKDNYAGLGKNEKVFRDSLCEYLGATFDELTKKSGGYAYYKDYTLTEEIQSQYNCLLGNEHLQAKELCDDSSP